MKFINAPLSYIAYKLKGKSKQFLLLIITATFVVYIFCPTLRMYIFKQNIDPNFVLGFLTTITLMISIIQSSKDRKLTYDMGISEQLRNNGLVIISKLVLIKHKSLVILNTLKHYKDAISKKQKFIDSNNITSMKDVNDGFELAATYADTYFKKECQGWNEMIDKIGTMATCGINVNKNYEMNLQLILNGDIFKNETLDRLDEIIANAEKTDKEIYTITENMRSKIIERINFTNAKVKDNL